jgi:hypothetical protein
MPFLGVRDLMSLRASIKLIPFSYLRVCTSFYICQEGH